MTRGTRTGRRKPGTFGSVLKLPSGRYRATYWGPDRRRHKAPTTFTTQTAAKKWLALQQADIVRNAWEPPDAKVVTPTPKETLRQYADQWLPQRKVRGQNLKPRTLEHYRKLLDHHILPALGDLPIASITRADVEKWYDALDGDTPTMRAHCYGLLRTLLGTAVTDEKIQANPAVLRGAGSAKRVHRIRPASIAELELITEAMPEHQRAMVLLASWCAMRFGELTALQRSDIDLAEGVIRIRRGAVRTSEGFKVGPPKSEAGIRDVAIPPHLMPAIEKHLTEHVDASADALAFPAKGGQHLAPASFYRGYYKARSAANRHDLRFHDLRHSGAVLAAATGATIAELMARLGHQSPQAAMRYQHAAQGADRRIADALSALIQTSPGG